RVDACIRRSAELNHIKIVGVEDFDAARRIAAGTECNARPRMVPEVEKETQVTLGVGLQNFIQHARGQQAREGMARLQGDGRQSAAVRKISSQSGCNAMRPSFVVRKYL